jgi:hypothetical protein
MAKEKALPVRSQTLLAIQTHPKDSFKIEEIFEQVVADNPKARKVTVTNVISTDFRRLGLVERTEPGGPRRGGVEYRITELGKGQDYKKIPSMHLGIKEVKRRQGQEMPKDVTDPGQVIKKKGGGFTKLEGEIDAIELADAFLDYVSFLKEKVQKLADKVSSLQSEHKKELEALNLDMRRKDNEIREQKRLIDKLHQMKQIKGKGFNLGELAQFRSSGNKP